MPTALRRRSLSLLVLPACALVLAACSSSPTPSASSTTTSTTSTAPSTTSTTGAASTSSTSQTSGTLAPQTATVTEFYSPSKNISCEIDNNFGSGGTTSTLCLTLSPPKSVTLMAD